MKTSVRIQHRIEAERFIDTTMDVEPIPQFEKLVAAFGALILCWFIALICVAIPVLHFILVPLALIAGVVAFFVRLRLGTRRTQTEFKCPSCKERLILKAGAFNFPLKDTCGSCRTGFTISPIEG